MITIQTGIFIMIKFEKKWSNEQAWLQFTLALATLPHQNLLQNLVEQKYPIFAHDLTK